MKHKAHLRNLCFLLAVLMLLMAGCQTTPQGNGDNTKPSIPASEDNGALNVFDKALTEGKMACYFLAGDGDWSAAEEGEHSGDAVLFVMADGTTALYDCETPNNGADIVYALQRLGITKLDYFINSHPHLDHMGGFAIIARYIEIGEIWMPDVPEIAELNMNTPYYKKMMEIAKEKNIPVKLLKAGDTAKLGSEVDVKVFNPIAEFDPSTTNYNESSLVLKLTWKNASFLVGGDTGNNPNLGQKTETILVERYGDELQADVSKINHHAEPSTQSTSDGWVKAVRSKIYVGTMSTIPNDVEHFRLLKMAMDTGAQYLHTGIDGTVLVTTTGDGTYDLYAQKLRPTDYYGELPLVDGHMRVE